MRGIVNPSTGEIIPVAAGQRIAYYSQAAYQTAKEAGQINPNSIVAILDDYSEDAEILNDVVDRVDALETTTKENVTVTFGSFTAQTAYVKKNNNVVQFYFADVRDHSGTSVSAWTTIATIPEGYRPTQTVYDFCGGVNSQMLIQINSLGRVQVYFNNNIDYELIANVTYIIDSN